MEATQVAPVDMFASTIQMILFFGSSLVFAISGQVIGRKLGHPSPWMAWIPLVNLFYYGSLAGASTATKIMFFIPILNIYAWAVTFASISERLTLPNWLGYAMLLPVANIFTIAYMAGSGKAVASRSSKFADRAIKEHLGSRA